MIGGWSDRAGQFFVDASAIIPRLEQARNLAIAYDQQEIFDVANNCCRPVICYN